MSIQYWPDTIISTKDKNQKVYTELKSGFRSHQFWYAAGGVGLLGLSAAIKLSPIVVGPLALPLTILGTVISTLGTSLLGKSQL